MVTAAQILPEILQTGEGLVDLQLTLAWVIPRHDYDIGPRRKAIYIYVPLVRKIYRSSITDEREGVFAASFDLTSAKHS